LAKHIRRWIQRTDGAVQTRHFDDEIPLKHGQDTDDYFRKAK